MVAPDGTELAVVDYLLPRAQAKGGVVLMHGLGEHSGRYTPIARFFNEQGLSVRSYDLRGHGRSGGARGDVPNGTPLLVDAELLIDDFARQLDQPPFLFGHSMGGLFATQFALSRRSPLRGLMLSSPALAVDLSALQRRLLGLMLRLAPWFGVPNGLRPEFLSHDANVVRAYRQDPLVHNKISARLLQSMLQAIEVCQAQAGTLSLPCCLIVAGDDHLVNPAGAQRFFAGLQQGMAEMHVYESCYHEVFNEPEAPSAFDDLARWLQQRL
nr:alpha/beta hydrolase [Massilia sp. TS11]